MRRTLLGALFSVILATSASAQVPNQSGMGVPNSTAGGAPSGAAGGDLGGTYPNPTVTNGSHITNASIPNSGLATPAPCSAFGTASGQCPQGGVITAGGPTGSATVAPIVTYNAAGQLTAVGSATITPAIGSITGLGTGVAAALGNTLGGAGGVAAANASTTVNGQTCTLGSTCVVTAPSYYLSGNWYLPFGPMQQGTGVATTANTIYCFYGYVSANVTIKSLGAYLSTGILTNTLQLAIYSQSGGTLTLVDSTGNITAGTAQSGSAINGSLSNTTDALKAGVQYAFCENSPGAAVLIGVAITPLNGQFQQIGSATQGTINTSTAAFAGRSIAQTYGTWPGTITESSMADVTTAVVTLQSFQVN
jgi:hypothetical protein